MVADAIARCCLHALVAGGLVRRCQQSGPATALLVCGGDHSSATILLPSGDAAQWAQGCEMVNARDNAVCAVVASADVSAHRLLVVGGDVAYNTPLHSCELYDATSDRWSLLAAHLPHPMRCRAASVAGGSAVLAVQWDDWHKTLCALLDVRSSSPCWQPMASAERAKHYHAVAAVGEHSVVLLGGVDIDGITTDTVQLYDTRADRWSERAEWRLPTLSHLHCAVLIC